MKETFNSYHPITSLIFFISIIGITMFSLNIVLLSLSLFLSIIYSLTINARECGKTLLKMILPIFIITILANILFSQKGATILFKIFNFEVTKEGVLYGFANALMLSAVIMWFTLFNKIFTQEKIIFIFGRLAPIFSLVFSMVLNFIPKLKRQIDDVAINQKALINNDENSVMENMKNNLTIFSAISTWSLENGIDKAMSMKARGYGLKNKTYYGIFKFKLKDFFVLTVFFLFIVFSIIINIMEDGSINYFPLLIFNFFSLHNVLLYCLFCSTALTFIIINIYERIKWQYLKSKI